MSAPQKENPAVQGGAWGRGSFVEQSSGNCSPLPTDAQCDESARRMREAIDNMMAAVERLERRVFGGGASC